MARAKLMRMSSEAVRVPAASPNLKCRYALISAALANYDFGNMQLGEIDSQKQGWKGRIG
ncbi:MAG: hypothetical protein ACE5I9_07290 [Candidatus Methylomirabilales bacterium]